MRPIPKELLIHSAMHHKQIKNDGFYDENTLDSGESLTFIRIEPSNKIIRNKNNALVGVYGREIECTGWRFYSFGRGRDFARLTSRARV